jgi:hypothetical protein
MRRINANRLTKARQHKPSPPKDSTSPDHPIHGERTYLWEWRGMFSCLIHFCEFYSLNVEINPYFGPVVFGPGYADRITISLEPGHSDTLIIENRHSRVRLSIGDRIEIGYWKISLPLKYFYIKVTQRDSTTTLKIEK